MTSPRKAFSQLYYMSQLRCHVCSGQPISHHEHLDAVYSVAPHPTLPSVVITASEDGCVYTVDTREPYRRGEALDTQLVTFTLPSLLYS